MKTLLNRITLILIVGFVAIACQRPMEPVAPKEEVQVPTVQTDNPLFVRDVVSAESPNARAQAETQINKVTNRLISRGEWRDVMIMTNSGFDRNATYLARLYLYTSGAQVDLYASDFVSGNWRVLAQNTSNSFPQKEIQFLIRADARETYIKLFGRMGTNVRYDLALYKLNAPAVERINYSTASSNQTNIPFGNIYGYIGKTAVYSNGPKYGSTSRNSVNGYDTGLAFQCVELVRRFYFEYFGKRMGAGYDAKDFYSNAWRWNMTAYANGGGMAPKPGDVLCYNGNVGGGAGHVELLAEVGVDYVIVIRQNVYGDVHVGKRYSRTGNTINAAHVQGWIR